MRTSIKFANDVTFEPLNILRYTETIRGADREVLEISFDGSAYDYETIEAIYDDESSLSTIIISEINTDEDGNTNETEFKYSNFDIPVSLSKTKNSDYTTITLKISQKTVSELQQAQIIQDNEDTQMAVIELAKMIDELSTSNDATTKEE